MSLLFRVVFAAATKNTHHRLALDALRLLHDPAAERRREMFLYHYEAYLKGSKAPDDEFKDFQNHVLHVRDNYWGGAVKAAQLWYKLTVDALRLGDWKEAAYSAGVLSHYVTDPCMPFHTGQTEAEGKVHRACEWSISQSYVELRNILEQDLGGYPNIEAPATSTWLADLIRFGAEEANKHYEACLDHYNLAAGVKSPPLGLDQELKDRIAGQLGLAAAMTARVLDRAFAEANMPPPALSLTLETLISTALVPIFWITKKLADVKDRAAVLAIFDEVQRTGKVVATLPEDERMVRRLHAEQVSHKPLRELDAEKPQPTGAQHGQGAPPRVRSNRASIVDWPKLLAMPKLPSLKSWKVRVPSPAADAAPLPEGEQPAAPAARKFPKLSMPKLSIPKLSIPKLSIPKLSPTQLEAAKKRLSQVKFAGGKLAGLLKKRKRKADEAGEELQGEKLKVAASAPVKASRKGVTSDLDAPVQTQATSPNSEPRTRSSSVMGSEPATIRRTDAPSATPPPPAETRRDAGEPQARYYLSLESPLEDAPSIGPKTARRFEAVGLTTVGDLLNCNPAKTAPKLNASFIDADVIRRWQRQATLVCRVPNLRGRDAQILSGCGVEDAEDLADRKAAPLWNDVEDFLATPEGEKTLRGGTRPDLAEIEEWIRAARDARPLQEA